MKTRAQSKPIPIAAALLIIAVLTACSKRSGEAIVVAKEYIAAGEEREAATPGESPSPAETASSSVSPTPSSEEYTQAEETETKPLAEDEVVVDGYVMKKDVQGTSKDPRAYPGLTQWRVSVRMIEGGRSFTVRAEQVQYERLKVGDRVKVRYREGDYTGTVWSAEIVD